MSRFHGIFINFFIKNSRYDAEITVTAALNVFITILLYLHKSPYGKPVIFNGLMKIELVDLSSSPG